MENTAAENVGDLFAQLLFMGFDARDCEQAISSGLLSVEHAVDWILNGKPHQGPSPTLRLRKKNESTFDSNVNVDEIKPIEKKEDSSSEVKVKSQRRTEEQRREWDDFHQKERKKAQSKAKKERREKEKNLVEVLERIELDKKEKRFQKTLKCAGSSVSYSKEVVSKSGPVSDDSITVIKLRCPDGSVLKRTYKTKDKLSKLWEDIIGTVVSANLEEMILIQPFPKYEFLKLDLDRTFEDFDLFPSGSLVLQNKLISKEDENESVSNDCDEVVAVRDDENVEIVPEQRHLPNLMQDVRGLFENEGFEHVWGEGQQLGADRERLFIHEIRAVDPPNIGLDRTKCYFLPCSVRSLTDICIQCVVEQLVDPIQSTISPKLPSSVVERIIEKMKTELVLTPRTFKIFQSCPLNNINLDFYPYATNELLYSLRSNVAVQNVSLVSCSLVNDVGLQYLTCLRRLRSLNLRGCRQLTDNAIVAIKDFPCLKSLNLDSTKITDTGIESYVQYGSRTLHHLNLSRTLITDSGLKSISNLINLKSLILDETRITCLEPLRNLRDLESLSLRSVPLVSDRSLACLNNLPSLSSLNLSDLTTIEGDVTLKVIKDLKLKELRLPSRLTTTDVGIAFISEMPLKYLDLSNYVHLTDKCLEFVGRIKTLEVLLLSNTKVSDTGLLFLDRLINLEVLYLDRTMITDVATTIFLGMTKLVELSLASTRVSKRFLINGNLNNCSLLNKLNLSFTRVTDKGLKQLRLKSVTLISVDGTRLRKADPSVLFAHCPRLRHVSAKNIVLRSSYDSSDDDD